MSWVISEKLGFGLAQYIQLVEEFINFCYVSKKNATFDQSKEKDQ